VALRPRLWPGVPWDVAEGHPEPARLVQALSSQSARRRAASHAAVYQRIALASQSRSRTAATITGSTHRNRRCR
jgi:hypothetical protein